jgi:hypothetical protein
VGREIPLDLRRVDVEHRPRDVHHILVLVVVLSLEQREWPFGAGVRQKREKSVLELRGPVDGAIPEAKFQPHVAPVQPVELRKAHERLVGCRQRGQHSAVVHLTTVVAYEHDVNRHRLRLDDELAWSQRIQTVARAAAGGRLCDRGYRKHRDRQDSDKEETERWCSHFGGPPLDEPAHEDAILARSRSSSVRKVSSSVRRKSDGVRCPERYCSDIWA